MTATLTVPEPWTVGPVTRTDFVRYQGASGDMNPIHHDQTYAEAAGYKSPFSVGMFQAGLLATYATDWLGAENVRSFRVRFLEQVWPTTCSPAPRRSCVDTRRTVRAGSTSNSTVPVRPAGSRSRRGRRSWLERRREGPTV